jgi:hypothetical protein
MDILLWLGAQIIWAVWTVVSWLLLQVFWLLLWSLLPICVAAILCALAAERVLGKALVRSWLSKHSLALVSALRRRIPRAVFTLWAVPARVAGWFVVFALWHALINLWRTPGWTPWRRAWRRRWGYA